MTTTRWRLTLTSVALVAFGALGVGLVQAVAAPAAGPAAAPASDATATVADSAILLDTLALMNDPTAAGAAVPAQLLGVRERLKERIANVRGRLVHGSLTVVDRDGKLVTWQLDHGTLSAVDETSITITEPGGSSVTVSTASTTRVRKAATQSTLANLAAGDEVLVRSTVTGATVTATLVIVLPAATTATPPTGGNG